jgi:hypothetical protein
MNKPISLALLAVGVMLIVYGVGASDSIGSALTRLCTASPTEKTVWRLTGGGLVAAIGLVGLLRASKSP